MMPIWRKKLGEEVRRIRGTKGQKEVASAVGISRVQLSIIENGTRSYSIEPLLVILAGINVSAKEITKADPIKALVSLSSGLNALNSEEIEACRTVVEALHQEPDRTRRLLGILREDAQSPPMAQNIEAKEQRGALSS